MKFQISRLLSCAAEVATVWAVVYALPDYLHQKRISDISDIADRSLDITAEIDLIIDKLHQTRTEDSRREMLHNLRDLYKKLYRYLKRLPSCPNILEHMKSVDKRLKILTTKDYSNAIYIQYFELELGKEFGDIIKENNSVPFIEGLEKDLITLFNKPTSQSCYWVTLLIFTGIVIALYFMSGELAK